MRAILLATAAAAGLAGSASAADLPLKAPAVAPPPLSWTGFYAGVNAGGTWSNNDIEVQSTPVFQASNAVASGAAAVSNAAAAGGTANLSGGNGAGFIGGAQVGYNWQLTSTFVAGIEADIQGVAGSGSNATATTVVPTGLTITIPPAVTPTSVNVTTNMSARKSLDYLGTVRGRIGYLFTPALLVYGTGGLAYGGVSLNVSGVQSVNPLPGGPPPFQQAVGFGGGTFSDARVGWTAGIGAEWKFRPKWSAKIEYLHYDLGVFQTTVGTTSELTIAGTTAWINATSARARFDGDVVRVGLNYLFN